MAKNDQDEQVKKCLEGHVFDLFRTKKDRIYTPRNKIPVTLVDDFAKRDEVLRLTRLYLRKIQQAWVNAYPNQETIKFKIPEEMAKKMSEKESLPLEKEKQQELSKFVKNVADFSAKKPPLKPDNISPCTEPESPKVEERSAHTPLLNQNFKDEVAVPPREKVPDSATQKNPKDADPVSIKPAQDKVVQQDILAESQASFLIANASSGKKFRAKIKGTNALGQPLLVVAAKISEDTGLSFDSTTGELHGMPDQAGEHRINLQWSYNDGPKRTGSCNITINANPKDLWKNLEPDQEAPYFKDNTASRIIDLDSYKILAASKRGRSHAHIGSFRDDAFFIDSDPSGWNVLIVADGAGSAKYSRQGAELAVNTIGKHLLEAGLSDKNGANILSHVKAWEADPDSGSKPLNDKLYYLFGEAVTKAVKAIDDEAQTKQAAFKDYSTTLLVSLCIHQPEGVFVASFWIGDGAICVYDKKVNKAVLMGSPDSGEFAGQTSFLDKSIASDAANIWDRIKFQHFDKMTSLILMTDGVSDPRFETDTGLADPEKWGNLWKELDPIIHGSEPDKKLTDWLDFFSPGHHDDRTISILW